MNLRGKDNKIDEKDRNAIRERVIQHYNRLAPKYADLYEGRTRMTHFYKTRQKRVLEFLSEVTKGGKVVEVGCGPGYMAESIAGLGLHYIGVDISTGMIGACKDHYSKRVEIQFAVGDMQKLPFPSCCVDAVLCTGALEYLPNEEITIIEMARVLKKGGLFILSGINKWSPYNLWDRILYRKITGRRPKAIVHEYHDEKQYKDWFVRCDLSVNDIAYFDFNVFVPPLDKRFGNISVTCSGHLESHCRGMFRILGNGFLIAAIRTV
jgi:ubiquinone/menaquinone biosynthesis C-methylase UbiE